ncbi:SDR family oxidoreductase [Acetobacter sp. DsW_063]|uniref:SDR family oxidoreductase n=1 Tax=Acetobacter sp. DsW_063 TaxID=1514894 RepID=UPI000A3D2E02|nr:SDR family oxidoreductase [Acetobacter sp. DsW_063]OUJ14015.1 3-oxoacyl-ACP reductase [Acetobacter sp. DsW_063]
MTTARGDRPGTLLLIGASRGLGLAMASEFAARGWSIVGTVRGDGITGLHDLADRYPTQVTIEALDITDPAQISSLSRRLSGQVFDMLFVNSGTSNRNQAETIAEVSTDEFVRVMLTNTLGVMRVIEGLQDLVRPAGLIGVMSSGQGSISNNVKGGREIYRGSKAALNQCMRSYAARHASGQRALVLMAPGWIRTELGGPEAPFGIEETVPKLVDTLIGQLGEPGLRFIDRNGKGVPW